MGSLVAFTLLSVLPLPGPASAQTIDEKQAEAAALATKLNEQARRIVALDIEHRRAQDDLAQAEAAVAQAEADLRAATRRQDELKRSLTLQAQDAYVVGGSISVLRFLVHTGSADDVARRAYLRIVTGQDRRLIGELRATREDLEDLAKRLETVRKRARAQTEVIAGDKASLAKAITTQRGLLQQVNGELVTLVAAEQARRDAEAARLAAATRAATAAPPATTRPAAGAPTGGALTAAAAPTVTVMTDSETWACIRQLESGNNYASPGGGAYQFLDSTWQSLGYTGTASDYPPAVQDEAAMKLQARSGWSQWTTAPLCGRT